MGNFLNKSKSWLEGSNLEFKKSLHRSCASTTSEGSRPQDRLKKNIIDWSIKTKRRKVVDLVKLWSAGELTTTSEIAHRLSGQRNVVTSIRKSTQNTEAKKIY